VTAADRGEVCEAAGADTLKQRTAHPNPTANTHTQAADVQATVQSTNPWPRTHTHLEDERLAINHRTHRTHRTMSEMSAMSTEHQDRTDGQNPKVCPASGCPVSVSSVRGTYAADDRRNESKAMPLRRA
jgi:hypothetical protein